MAINTKVYSDNNLVQQDDFRITDVYIYNYKGDKVLVPDMLDINIYESIYNATLSGSISFVDIDSIVERLPVIGKEFIEFKIRTPVKYNGEYGGEINAVKHKFFVYKVSVKEQASFRNQVISLEFCSPELIRNSRIRVSKAYEGSYDQAVKDLFESEKILNSKKPLFIEKTRLNQKVVVPNLRPIDTINMFASRALSTVSNSASFFFFETTQGFHFRSLDSMFRDLKTGVSPATPMFQYSLETSGQPNPDVPTRSPYKDLQRVYSHSFKDNTDTIQDNMQGAYASKLITHNLYDKTFSTKEFNYTKDYFSLPHLEQDESLSDFPLKYSILPENPADPTDENTNKEGRYSVYSDYTDGKLMVTSNTSKIHNTSLESGYHTENTLQTRKHTLNILKALTLKMTTPGNTHINAGQIVHVTVPSYASEAYEKTNKQFNRFLTGRYLVTDVRHNIDFGEEKHKTSLTLSKETYAYPLASNSGLPDIEYEDEKTIIDVGTGTEYA